MLQNLRSMIERHEGRRKKPYRDSAGKWTVGVGHNLEADDKPLSDRVVDLMLDDDIAYAQTDAKTFPWFAGLDSVRQDVIVDMIFNMGLITFSTFRNTIALIAAGDYTKAADYMLQSLWARQVGPRAIELSKMMRTGTYGT